MGCVLLLPMPGFRCKTRAPSTHSTAYGYLVYGKAQQYGAIFYSPF